MDSPVRDPVLARDFQLQVLEGRTGRLLRRDWLPKMSPELKDRPYELNIGDSLCSPTVRCGCGSTRRIGRSPAPAFTHPTRNPHYNDSNYRASVSRPGWADR
jgi:hypothetical protein